MLTAVSLSTTAAEKQYLRNRRGCEEGKGLGQRNEGIAEEDAALGLRNNAVPKFKNFEAADIIFLFILWSFG